MGFWHRDDCRRILILGWILWNCHLYKSKWSNNGTFMCFNLLSSENLLCRRLKVRTFICCFTTLYFMQLFQYFEKSQYRTLLKCILVEKLENIYYNFSLRILSPCVRNARNWHKHQPKLGDSFLKRKNKQTKNTCGLLYPGEMKLQALFSRQSFAGLQSMGKMKVRKNVSKTNFTALFFNTPIN